VIAYRAAIGEGRLKSGNVRLGLQRMLYFDLYLSRRVNPWQPAFRRPESKSGMTLFCTIEYDSTAIANGMWQDGCSRMRPLWSVGLLWRLRAMLRS